MTETRDPLLQSLFEQARQDLDGAELTARVMASTRKRLMAMGAVAVAVAGVVLLSAWTFLSMPLLEFAVLVSQFMTDPLVDLGEGWLALAALPVNNIASIAVLTAKLGLMGWKKLTGASLLR